MFLPISGATLQAKLGVPAAFHLPPLKKKDPETAKSSTMRLLLGQARQKMHTRTHTYTGLTTWPVQITELILISHAKREQGRLVLGFGLSAAICLGETPRDAEGTGERHDGVQRLQTR